MNFQPAAPATADERAADEEYGVTTPFDGADAPGREPAPENRPFGRKKRFRGKRHSPKSEPAGQTKGGIPHEKTGEIKGSANNSSIARSIAPSSTDTVDNANAPHLRPEDTSTNPSSKRKRRRRGKKRGRGHSQDVSPELALRNLRAPVTPTPDVTFDAKERAGQLQKRIAKSRNGSGNAGSGGKRFAKAAGQHGSKRPPLYAALDLGTNNCRLLIATPMERGRFRVVDAFSRIVRLGEGLGTSGELSQDAMDRAVGALAICAEKLAAKRIRKLRLIATEACRQASNGEAFLKRVKSETGLDLEIVNRETEARLAAEGCGSLLDRKADGAVLFDIGGGSSELILVNAPGTESRRKARSGRPSRRISDRIAAWTSLPLGVVTLSERFGGGQEVSREKFDAMVADVVHHIEAFEGRNCLEDVWSSGRVHLLGTSGTVTTIAGVHLELPRYDRRKVDGVWLKGDDIDRVINSLLDMDFHQRAQNPCIGNERADLVLAGCAILQAIRQTWPAQHLRVADRGLREGLLSEMITADGTWLPYRKQQRGKYGWRNRQSSGKGAAS